jgi:hypothetical protein
METKTHDKWLQGITPTKATTTEKQPALDWWHKMPIQDIYDCKWSWANLCIKYHPNKTECYHFSEDEVYDMWKQEVQ